MERNTHQKQVIIDYLKSVNSHPTAEEVFQAVKVKLPSISRSTVYRILKAHGQKNEILELGNEINHYDANTAPHAHFVCEKCHKVFDVFNQQSMVTVKDKAKVKYVVGQVISMAKVNNYRVYLYGICDSCQQN